jgi:hypothetical protein
MGIVGLVAVCSGAVLAQAPKKPDGTVKLTEGAVAVGIGWTWGRGTLTYKGKTQKFKVEGLSVGELGVTKAEASGNVFNLKNLEDFSGIYRAASAGATAVKGKDVTALENEKGVVLELKSATKGASLKLALEGVKLALEP